MHHTHSVALNAGVLTWIYETHVKLFMLYMPKHYIISICIDNGEHSPKLTQQVSLEY